MDLSALTDLCTPWCIHVVATLKVANRIAEGIHDSSALGRACGADPESLERVLRYLAQKGIFEEPAPGYFALNDAARPLTDENLRAWLDLEGIAGRMALSWSTMLSAVRTGKTAYPEVFGRGFWGDLEAHPSVATSFDALMGPAGHGIPDPRILLDEKDWASIGTVVDVGGGTGALLIEILRARPEVHGTLVDLRETIHRARPMFEAAGLMDRVTLEPQSFFDPLPAGKDLYTIKNVIADWPDAEAVVLLRRCAEAARPGGRVVVLGGVTPEKTAAPELLMMVLVGGKGRTLEQFTSLATAAGLQVRAAGYGLTGRFSVECVPAA